MENKFKNIKELFDSTKQHIRDNPNCIIEQDDKPMALCLGWKDIKFDIGWYINLVDMRRSFSLLNDDVPKQFLYTVEGKKELIKYFYK